MRPDRVSSPGPLAQVRHAFNAGTVNETKLALSTKQSLTRKSVEN